MVREAVAFALGTASEAQQHRWRHARLSSPAAVMTWTTTGRKHDQQSRQIESMFLRISSFFLPMVRSIVLFTCRPTIRRG